MIDQLIKHAWPASHSSDYTIIIPTWNNVSLLQLCVKSIRHHSAHRAQIIIIINEGKDGTLEWVKEQHDLDYVYSPKNIGICFGLNSARSLIRSPYIVYLNDDMYVLPGWDKALMSEVVSINTKAFMLSGTMIEPYDTGNSCVVIKNYGTSPLDFNEQRLLEEYETLKKSDWSGSTWPPNMMHIEIWDLVGGMSIEYSPGMYSDPDLSRKLVMAGVTLFKGKGNSLVYHFGSKSTSKVKRNKGRNMFLLKWGITAKFFSEKYLHSGEAYTTHKPDASVLQPDWLGKIKRILAGL